MRYTNLLLIVLLSVFFSNDVFSDEKIISELKKGGKIIFIRHALAPGNGDPDNINLDDCKTQRNLSAVGIDQSKQIGYFFLKYNIPVGEVLSSEWCRCKDTAKYAFNNYKTFNALNSFYDKKFLKFKDSQITDLKNYVNDWNGNDNLILVTHFVVISELLNISSASSEIIISNKEYQTLGRILIKN